MSIVSEVNKNNAFKQKLCFLFTALERIIKCLEIFVTEIHEKSSLLCIIEMKNEWLQVLLLHSIWKLCSWFWLSCVSFSFKIKLRES